MNLQPITSMQAIHALLYIIVTLSIAATTAILGSIAIGLISDMLINLLSNSSNSDKTKG